MSHVRVCLPQKLQSSVADPVHICPGQAAGHLQVFAQVCMPPAPHMRVAPGEQSPSPEHAVQSDHAPLLVLHVRVRAPHKPHASTAAPMHFWPVHASSHWQLPAHDCVPFPFVPQPRVVSGVHTPSPKHSDHADHSPVFMSQMRVRVPQLPQASAAAPGQVCPVHATSH